MICISLFIIFNKLTLILLIKNLNILNDIRINIEIFNLSIDLFK